MVRAQALAVDEGGIPAIEIGQRISTVSGLNDGVLVRNRVRAGLQYEIDATLGIGLIDFAPNSCTWLDEPYLLACIEVQRAMHRCVGHDDCWLHNRSPSRLMNGRGRASCAAGSETGPDR